MKNYKLNLIKGLWDDSHEKQKPQRFARYAAMLIMLLTLGVGQMWATDYYYRGGKNSWGATKMAVHNSGLYAYYPTNGTATSFNGEQFKIALTTSGYDYNKDYVSKSYNGGISDIGDYGGDNCYIWSSSNVLVILYYPNTALNTTNKPIISARTGLYAPTFYIKHPFADGSTWSWGTMSRTDVGVYTYTGNCYTASGANVYMSKSDNNYISSVSGTSGVNNGVPAIWTYNATSNSLSVAPAYTLTVNNDGHGSASGSVSKGIKMSTKYAISASSPSTGYHFYNWTRVSGGTCTFDNASSASTKVTVTGDASATVQANFALNTYTVAYNANDDNYPGTATGSTSSSSHTYSTAKKLTSNGFSRTGYTFAGWATTPTGSVAYTNGQSVTNLTSTHGATVTLYAKWTENMSDVTLVADPEGKGTFTIGGAAATSTTAGVTTTRSVTAVPIAGYSFDSWSISGGASISSTSTNPTTVTGGGAGTAATLTATFVENPVYYDVTFGVGTSYTSLGSLSATNNTTSSAISSGDDLLSASSVTFTASPNTGYVVEGWYTDAACTEGKHDAGETTYSIASLSGDVTVYVKFVEKTWSVAFAAGTGGTVTTPNSTPQTVGQVTGISIAATPATGYTFNTWTITSGSGSFTSAATTNSNTFKPTAASTITASFNETKSTITVTTATSSQGTLKFGSTSKSWGATASLGVATTQSITATAAAGFRFVRWDLSGAAASSSTLTNTTITLKADGSGSTGTATAVFEEDLSSPWIVAGGNKIVTTGTTWRTTADANNTMLKKTGHSTESVVYFTVPVTTVCSGDNNGNFQFKIYNTSTSKWYGLFASGSYYLLKAEDGTEKSLVEDNQNIELRAYVTGDYVLKLDYSTSTPKLTVTWPVYNQVRISAASPSDAGNVGNYDLSDPVSNVRTVTRSLKANTTYTFKIMYNSDWYGFNSGTFTRSNSTSSNSRTISTSGGNMTLTTDYAGDYTFKFNQSTKALSIDFPEAYKVTYGKGAVDGSSGNNCSAKDIDNGNASVTSNSTWVKSGNQVVLTAPTEDSGYTFDGWFDNNSSTGDAITTAKNCTITVASAETYYACYHEHKTAITITTDGHGTITTPNPNNSPYSLGVATMQAINATASTGYHWNTWTTSGNAALVSSATTQSNTVKGNGTEGGTGTVTATFTANTYQVQFHRNGGAGDVVYQDFTYDAAQDLTANTYTKTGYNFAGWATAADGSVVYADEANVSNLTATNNGTYHLYAKWTAKTTTITYNQSGTGYSSGGQSTTKTATYDAAMPTPITTPTAANGYAFMGYYDDEDGEGTQYYNADGTSARTWNKEDAEVTLYAYFKKAEVTGITFSPAAIVATNATVTATPTISPTPTGTTAVCWELQYSNGTRVPSQPTFTPGVGNAVSFTAPSTSATYRLQAVLHLDDCNGDELSVYSETFQVAGEHTVTVRYQDSDGRTLAASTEITGRPLTWTEDAIEAPTITGYTFARWDAGDGVTIKNGESDPVTTTTTSSIQIKAVYDGTLTAVYTKKRMIYFYNTLGWGSVYVYFYKNDSYWQTVSPYKGSGSKTSSTWTDTPYELGKHGQMQPVSEGSNIYYFDAEAEGVPSSYDDVVFTEHDQHNYEFFWKTNAVRRGDYKTTMPMFVPLADQTADVHNETNYYNSGYWMNYPENSGYTLKIYNAYDATKETAAVQSIAFPYSEDLKMPLKLDVELSDGYNHNYWFMVYRNDGTYMGGIYTFKQGYQDEQVISGGNNKNQITTSAPGNYTFTLTYHDNGSGTNNYYIDVDFPIATGDYRIVYKDNAAWSHGTHGASWCHPSHSIAKATTEAKKDTVSFFISKAVGITPSMKFQKASITNEGVVTWADVAGGSITIPSSVTETGVYNFIVSQPAGGASISLEKVEPYTGNFYIRTDCAGNTKWDSFKNVDHQMTYSDYAEDHSGYSHYFVHWVESGNNVKFTIANDYSMCISDTLVEDYGTTIANISNIGALNSGNASIRFMWNQATNKISRAYISGSSNVADRFLVLEGDAKMFDENGNVLTDAGGGKISGLNDYEMNLLDDQNFVYERTIQVKTTARAKLTAKYNNNVQYFKGSSGDFAEGTTIQLLGGEPSDTKHTMRIVYDFKTNRLVTAYVPSEIIEDHIAINADLMIVREHQNAGQQLLFNEGSLSDVHTVYGVMRFNKWTLNNKEKTGGHSPVGDPKSAYERSVFWISFPFDVKLSDVFGFGTYGVDWIIEYYDGAARAAEGYWADSKGFWKYVMPSQRSTYELKAGKGYALVLDLARMKDDNEAFWPNSIEQVELFFPSTGNVGGIEATDVTTTAESHLYDAAAHPGHADDRTYKDSHWNMIGVPSYANYGTTLTSDGSTTITWSTPVESDLPYLYEWNAVDNTYTAQTGSTYPFKSMHSYMVQYHGSLHWSLASATPVTPIVARRTYADKPQNVELRLELSQNEKMIDQTFVKLSNDEEVSAAFKFDEDLSKEMNKNKANIYTMIADLSVAGNTMPMSEQTTVVPVGVKIAADGDYTFAIPDGTEGIGVTLVDTETGVRTSLSALDYTVNLSAGTYNERFVLEISPIKQTPTGIEEVTGDGLQVTGARKVMIDGLLYIVKDGKVFDARGAVVK